MLWLVISYWYSYVSVCDDTHSLVFNLLNLSMFHCMFVDGDACPCHLF